ncbi:MAG TPA: hypothetical protein VEV38_06490 [Candidatus Eremiobacteraceae bacterium]|nr:hypothetical protein [Candidatus Eremiobacteraceae bacterium]
MQMRQSKTVTAIVIFGVLLVAAACGGNNSGAPASNGLTGNWHGTVQDSLFGTGQVSFQVTQTGSNVAGKWTMTFSNPPNDGAGDVSGSTSGASVQMTFAPASPNPCTTFVTGSVAAGGDQMSGTYNNGNCPNQESGTFTASK